MKRYEGKKPSVHAAKPKTCSTRRTGFGKAGLLFLLSFLIAWMPVAPAFALTYRELEALRPGNPVITQSRQLASGISQESWKTLNRAGKAVVYQTLTLQASDPMAQAVVWSGSSVTERNTVSAMAEQARANGHTVVAAVNGDFYNVDTGAPIGIVIHNGELLSSDGSYVFAAGFRPDGSTLIGKPALRYVLSRNGALSGSFALNKQQSDNGPFVYTRKYGTHAGSSRAGVDVVVSVLSDRFAVGGSVEGNVLEVRQDTQGTAIGPNQVILSARAGTAGHAILSTFAPGDTVRMEVQDPTGEWTDVAQALGGLHRLLQNGLPVTDLSTTNVNPATLLGRKPDGSIVLFQTDGRQSDWSNGVSYSEGATLMLAMGCTDAIVLDGGGSSTVLARNPGTVVPALANRPSDGSQRRVSNALLLVSRSVPLTSPDPLTGMQSSNAASMLHLYPGRQYLLPGATVSFDVKATDAGYYAAAVPPGILFSSTGGVFDTSGKMIVTGAPGLHTVSAVAGAAMGEASFIIPEHLTAIKLSSTSVVLAPGTSVDLKATGYLEGVEVVGVDSSFVWSVDPAVGVVTGDGVFTATGEAGATGLLRVSWNSSQTEIPVSVARLPIDVEGFEGVPAWQAIGIKAPGAAARSIADTELALFGDGVLRLWYDFRVKTAADAGTAGLLAGPVGPDAADGSKSFQPIPLEGIPTGIGMWVYGNGSRYWLRGRIADATGREVDLNYTAEYKAATATGGIDWTGWRYVEAAIPAGLTAPYRLTVPVRLMCPQEERKGTGTLLVDRIRSVYGIEIDDGTPPEIAAVWPADQETVATGTLTLSTRSYDVAGESGLNPDRTSLKIDGVPVAPVVSWEDDGAMRVSAQLGTDVPLAGGYHVASLRVEDLFGNKTTRTWGFHVNTPTPRLKLTAPQGATPGEVFDVLVELSNPNPLKAMDVVFRWNPALLEPVDMNPNVAGIQLGSEKVVTDARIARNEGNAAGGTWHFSVSALNSTIKATERKLLTLRFRARAGATGTAAISVVGGSIQVSGVPATQSISLPATSTQIQPALQLDVRAFVAGSAMQLTVTDRQGSLVPGATVSQTGAGPLVKTDAYGTATFPLPKEWVAGKRITLQATKDGLSSPSWAGVVGAASQGAQPHAVTVSPISQPGGMTVHWLSTASAGSSVQVMELKAYGGVMTAESTKSVATITGTTLKDPASGAALFEHKAVFYGLKSGTAYKWRITDGKNGNGTTGQFTTPVSGVDEAFRFGFLTDPQALDAAGYVPFRGALRRLLGQAPDLSFLILGGDVVDNGGKASQWWGLFETAGLWLSSLPVLGIPGNHEYKDDATLSNYKAFWGLPATGPSGSAETCYTVQNGNARFYMLDTQADLGKQLSWLQTERAASVSAWNIVVMHRGIYGGFYDEAEIRAKAAPVFDAIGIDLVLSGHDHTWQRTTIKGGQKVKPGEGTTYITGGSSGAKFYDAPARSWKEVSYDGNTPSFTLFSVHADRLEVSASHVEGIKTVTHDRFVIRK